MNLKTKRLISDTLTSDNITLPLGNDSFPNDPRANESLLTNRTIEKRQQQREF